MVATFHPRNVTSAKNRSHVEIGSLANTLHQNGMGLNEAHAVALRGRDGGSAPELGDDKAHALRGTSGGSSREHVLWRWRVRRLTPRESERCMGWPDDHTRWTDAGKEIADGHRYQMIGNGVATPVAEWIARRLMAVMEGAA